MEVVHVILAARVQRRIMEHVVDVPVPQTVEGVSEVAHFILQESITKGIDEQNVDVPKRTFHEHFQVPVP